MLVAAPVVLAPASASAPGSGSGSASGPVTLAEALDRASRESPELQAAHAEALSAREEVRAAGGWPDPRVSVGVAVEPVETRLGPQEIRVGVTQPLPLFATPSLRADVARGRADQRLAAVSAVARRVAHEVTIAYADLAYLERATAVTRTTADLLADVEAVARARYEGGQATSAQVIRAEVEAARVADRAEGLTDRLTGARARLEARMGMAVTGEIQTAGLPDPPPLPDRGTLAAALDAENPELRGLDAAVEGARAAERLAGRRRWPELSVGVDWVGIGTPEGMDPPDAGRDAWMAMAMVELPLFFGARDGAHDAARAARLARESQRRARALDLASVLEVALASVRELERRVVLFEETLWPRAEEAVAATTESFSAGAASLTDLVDAHRVRLDLILDLERARADLLVRRAEIDRLIGPDPGTNAEEVSP
jgi:outer membrane protein TolC